MPQTERDERLKPILNRLENTQVFLKKNLIKIPGVINITAHSFVTLIEDLELSNQLQERLLIEETFTPLAGRGRHLISTCLINWLATLRQQFTEAHAIFVQWGFNSIAHNTFINR